MNRWTLQIQKCAWPDGLEIPEFGQGIAVAERVSDSFFPGMKTALLNTPQDPIFHAEGDVWTHTLMVVDELTKTAEYANLSRNEKGVIFYAALLHDISKPETTKEQDGKIIAPGHSKKGAVQARILLWELGLAWELREQVARLIEVHQVPFFAFKSKKWTSVDYLIKLLSVDRSLKLLTLLAEADIRGRICSDQQDILMEIELFSVMAKELNCWDKPYSFPSEYTRMAYFLSNGGCFSDEPVYVPEDQFEVILLSGIPASGKSTWRSKNSQLPCISYDDIRQEMKLKHGEGTGKIVHTATDRMKELLRQKKPFVVDATHLSEQMRQKTIKLIRDYHGGVRVICFEAPKHTLLSRNQLRNSSLPNSKLEKMIQNWEFPGFTEVEFREVHQA